MLLQMPGTSPMSVLHPGLGGALLDFPTVHCTDTVYGRKRLILGRLGYYFLPRKRPFFTRTCCCIVKGKAMWVVATSGSCLSPSCSWGTFVAQHKPEATLDIQHVICHGGHPLLDVQKSPAQDPSHPLVHMQFTFPKYFMGYRLP